MLKRTLTEHATECFFGDEKLATLLWDELLKPADALKSDSWGLLTNKFYTALVERVEVRYPREHRLTDVRQLMGQMLDDSFLLTSNLPWLDELQQRLLQRNGDLLCYREKEVQAYVRLAAGLDPTLLAGWHFARWLDEFPRLESHDICRVIQAQRAFFAPPGNPSLPFAEGHVHWGGSSADSAILDANLFRNLSENRKDKLGDSLFKQLKDARHLLRWLLDQNRDWTVFNALDTDSIDAKSHLPDWSLLQDSQRTTSVGSADWILGEFARAMEKDHPNRWLWLYTYLCRCYLHHTTIPQKRAAILCFWQKVNLLRRNLIMDGQGLTRFVEQYSNPAIKRDISTISGNYHKSENIWSGINDVAEIKSNLLSFNNKFVKKITNELQKKTNTKFPEPPYIFGEHEAILDGMALASIQAMERWQFCGCFSRSSKQKQRPKPDSNELWLQAKKVMDSLESTSGWNNPDFLGGTLNSSFHFQPARWFRGLDVAGDENALKIEWFAPMIRWLRSGFKPLSVGSRARTGFHLSIHVGEDYAHPVSGMRHIDETVRFCEMREGDRLGHALALGIVPKQWAARQGEMILPLDEHLDNLVWLWHHASVLSGLLPLAQQVLPLFERRIARFWRLSRWWQVPDLMADDARQQMSVDPDSKHKTSPLYHATPDELYQAWWLRRNCHYRLQSLSESCPIDSSELCALPDYHELSEHRTTASQLYQARHDWLDTVEKVPLVIVRMGDEAAAYAGFQSKPQHSANEHIVEDIDTLAELDFMHALQDWLLTEYDKLGLIIEANPTSNVYIARLKSHAEHPIFRWYPPDEAALEHGAAANRYGLRRGPVRVLVNTDDPGIMPTTLRTEFLLLREAAFEQKIGRTVVEKWLETLRQYGIEQFHRNHLQVFEPV